MLSQPHRLSELRADNGRTKQLQDEGIHGGPEPAGGAHSKGDVKGDARGQTEGGVSRGRDRGGACTQTGAGV